MKSKKLNLLMLSKESSSDVTAHKKSFYADKLAVSNQNIKEDQFD